MSDQAATQLANITAATGLTVDDYADLIRASGLEKHGQIVAFLKSEHGLGHGNANLIAHVVRERLAGGPAPAVELLDAQYAGAKAGLRPIAEAVGGIATGLGADVEVVVQKTGVSYRRRKQFLLVQAPSSSRVQLGLNLPETPDDPRVRETSGMCSHRVDVRTGDEIDDALRGWIASAYDTAG